jgi:hypothetical protein
MPRLKLIKATGPITVALTMFDLWQRLPPKQRRLIAQQVRRHGPRLAKQAATHAVNSRWNRRRP